MITKLRLHNFKTFLNFEIELTRRHLLIGKNNSGKTNFCYGLRFLGSTACNDYSSIRIPGGQEAFCHWDFDSNQTEIECTCELDFEGERLTFEYKLLLHVSIAPSTRGSGDSPITTKLERLSVRGHHWPDVVLLDSNGRTVKLLHEERFLRGNAAENPYVETQAPPGSSMLSKLYELETNKRATLFRRFLSSLGYYSLSPPLMRYGWTSKELAGDMANRALAVHGQNLPLALFQLKNEDEPRYRSILKMASRIEPTLDSIGFYVLPDNTPVPYVFLKRRKQQKVSWEVLSDGTLCILGLSALVTQAERIEEMKDWPPCVIAIEEPENSICRAVFQDIWEDLRSVAPRSQVIFTSHSPYFVDLFDRDLGSITRLRQEQGRTTARSLVEYAEQIAQLRDDSDLSLGEQYYKEVFE
ncbi:MAG TPA: AAA family ATPase [Phycisphaerae bacterium]|nr:AAA family ATPase [Phycisphaerae bacterium]